MSPYSDFLRSLAPAALVVTGMFCVAGLSAALPAAAKERILAQKVVEEAKARHAETTEVGISARTKRGCRTIASTDPGDIGESCEREDVMPMRTGKPFVEKEKDGFDVSLPLHDAEGRLIGAVGIEFKLKPGQTQAEVVAQAKRIASEMEKQIPAKASLYARSQ